MNITENQRMYFEVYMKGLKSGLKPDYNPNKKSVRDSENKQWLKKKKGKL